MKKKKRKDCLFRAALWFAAVFMGCVVLALLDQEQIPWGQASLAGLVVAVLEGIWDLFRTWLADRKCK